MPLDLQDPQPEPPSPLAAVPALDLLQLLWRRKSLVMISLVVGLVLGTLYYVQCRPTYRSEAQVLVVKKRPDAVTGVDTRQLAFEDYVSTHQVLVKSPLIVSRAIQKRDLGSLKCLAEAEDVTEAVITSLTVTRNKGPSGNNNVLELSFRGKDADESSLILSAVIESYKDFLDETYRTMSDDTLELVTKARNVLKEEIAQKEMKYQDFRKQTPLLLKGKEGNTLRQDSLIAIEAKRSGLLLRRAEIQAHLEAFEAARKERQSRATLLAMVTDFASRSEGEESRQQLRPGLTAQEQIFPLLVEEKKLLEDYGPDHPQVKAIRKRIEVARDFFTRPAATFANEPASAGRGPDAGDTIELHVQSLKQRLNQIKMAEQMLTELFEKEHNEARTLTHYEIEDEMLRADIHRSQQLYEGIIKRLQEVSLVKDVGGYDAKTIAPPTLGRKVSPKPVLVFPVAAFLGLLGGVGLAYLADLQDKSFRSAEEVRRRLGLPLVGYIPLLRPDEIASLQAQAEGPGLDPMLCTYYRPKSMEAEAYRGVRTSLYFSTHGQGHQVIQVTSPNPGDGKSTLAANLAVSVAQSGRRIVLIDADLRKPRMHEMFGVSARLGLASVIAGEADPGEAVQETSVPNLAVLPCGPLPPNPAELLTSPRFKELLDSLREQYDLVIVDTPPLLAVTDPSVVAPRADGVLLTVRITKNGRPHAERAREILATLGANVLGVVINGTDRRAAAGGYGYGQYGYAYAESYHNGDGAGRPQSGGPAGGPTDGEVRPVGHSEDNGKAGGPLALR